MARYNEKRLPYAVQERLMISLCKTLHGLGSPTQIKHFLKDLLNRQERMMIMRRLLIAELLEQGNGYRDIKDKMHCGDCTIARVQRLLNFGRGGYKSAIQIRHKK